MEFLNESALFWNSADFLSSSIWVISIDPILKFNQGWITRRTWIRPAKLTWSVDPDSNPFLWERTPRSLEIRNIEYFQCTSTSFFLRILSLPRVFELKKWAIPRKNYVINISREIKEKLNDSNFEPSQKHMHMPPCGKSPLKTSWAHGFTRLRVLPYKRKLDLHFLSRTTKSLMIWNSFLVWN